jgi:hypothetical protein
MKFDVPTILALIVLWIVDFVHNLLDSVTQSSEIVTQSS